MAAKPLERAKKSWWFQQTELWQQPANKWVSLLVQAGVDAVAKGNSVSLLCPYHDDHVKSGTINLVSGVYRCYAASCTHPWEKDPIQFLSKIVGSAYAQTLELYKNHFDTDNKLAKKYLDELDEEAHQTRRLGILGELLHTHLCNIWQKTHSEFNSEMNARTWLRHRGIVDVQAISSIGLYPRLNCLKTLAGNAGVSAEDYNWIVSFLAPYTDTRFVDNIAYLYGASPDRISAIKLRKPGEPKETAYVTIKARSDEPIGVFGILNASYRPLIACERIQKCIVFEGEHDQLRAFVEQTNNGSYDHLFFAFGGSGHDGLDCLANLGLTFVDIVGDNDAGGAEIPVGLIDKSLKASCRIFTYPPSLALTNGEKADPDEIIGHLGFAPFLAEITNDSNYTSAYQWCYERASAALSQLTEDNVILLEQIVVSHGTLLHLRAELQAYIDLIQQDYPSINALQIMQSVIQKDDTPANFAFRCSEALLQEYVPLRKHSAGTPYLELYHKRTRTVCKVDLSSAPSAMNNLYSQHLKRGIDFINKYLEWPSYLADVRSKDSTLTAVQTVESQITYSCHQGLLLLSCDAPDESTEPLGQGLHLQNAHKDTPVYINNGNNTYRLELNPHTPGVHRASVLEGPRDGNTVMDYRCNKLVCADLTQGWWPELTDPTFFNTPASRTPEQLIAETYEILSLALEVEHQDLMLNLLKYWPIYSVIHSVIPRKKSLLVFNGPTESGKSAALSLFCQHKQMSRFALTSAAASMDLTTLAAFYQICKNISFLVGLDEFNNVVANEAKSSILEAIRGLATGGAAERYLGTREGGAQVHRVTCPVILAGYASLADPMDLNRYTSVNFVKNMRKSDTYMVLDRSHPQSYYAQLRQDTMRVGLNYAALIGHHFEHDIYKLADTVNTRRSVAGKSLINTNRLVTNMLPIISIAEILNAEGGHLMEALWDVYASTPNTQQATTPSYTLADYVINTPCILIGNGIAHSIRTALQQADTRELINAARCGIYYDNVSQCIGIVWAQILVHPALRHIMRDRSIRLICQDLEQCHGLCLPINQAQQLGILNRLKAHGLAGAAPSETSILKVGHIIEEAETYMSVPPGPPNTDDTDMDL